MPSAPAPKISSPYLVQTHQGDGTVVTDGFPTAQARLDSLRQRAQGYFPGSEIPRTPADTDEAAYLAQLLGFFLMLKNGKVALEDVTVTGE